MGKFVEGESAQPLADAGHARIILRLEERPFLVVELFDRVDLFFGIDDHRSELEGVKHLAPEPVAFLLEQDGAFRVELDKHADDEPHRGRDGEQREGEDDVEYPLGQEVRPGQGRVLDPVGGKAEVVVHLDLSHPDLQKVGDQGEPHVARVAGLRGGEEAFVRLPGSQDDDLVPIRLVEEAEEFGVVGQHRNLTDLGAGVAGEYALLEHGRDRTAANQQDGAGRLEPGQPVVEPERQGL